MPIRWLLCTLLLFAPAAWADSTIMVFGDSLSANYGIAVQSGWVSLLQQRLASNHYRYRVVNASISGETTAGGRARIATALARYQPAVVIVELGGNDGLRGLSLAETETNLDAIVHACVAAKAQVLLAGMRLPPNYGPAYTERFAAVYPNLAKKYRTTLVPFLLQGLGEDRAAFQADGIHPRAEAEPMVMENVWKRLRPLLEAR